jgi:hypothetical protein
MKPEDIIAGAQAMQDQEIAEGVAWTEAHDRLVVAEFWNRLNECEGPDLRDMSDTELRIVLNFAMVGMFEVIKAWVGKQSGNGGAP